MFIFQSLLLILQFNFFAEFFFTRFRRRSVEKRCCRRSNFARLEKVAAHVLYSGRTEQVPALPFCLRWLLKPLIIINLYEMCKQQSLRNTQL
jgi:hypothetical protein